MRRSAGELATTLLQRAVKGETDVPLHRVAQVARLCLPTAAIQAPHGSPIYALRLDGTRVMRGGVRAKADVSGTPMPCVHAR